MSADVDVCVLPLLCSLSTCALYSDNSLNVLFKRTYFLFFSSCNVFFPQLVPESICALLLMGCMCIFTEYILLLLLAGLPGIRSAHKAVFT